MAETAIHASFQVEMVHWFDKMGPVKMSIDAKHLAEDGLAYIDEILWESAALSYPVTTTYKLRQRGVERSRSCRNRSVRSRGVETARCKSSSTDTRTSSVVRERDCVWIGGEDIGVVNLALNPSLHERDVFVGWDFDWLSLGVEPSE